jgi:cation diffusion facilitator CzcD-associated flavoprotein CzcO
MYSFSFEQNPGWSRAYSPQPEIWRYMREVAAKYGLHRFIRFGQEMTGARWDGDESRWYVASKSGDEFVAPALVAGVGALHLPQIPKLPGIERFRGRAFHSAQWEHDYDLTGKRVAVVGTGASAIQFVPRIAKDVAELTLFQRTPPWIMPKPDREMPPRLRAAFRSVPLLQRVFRNALCWMLEARAIGFNGHPAVMKIGQRIAKRNITKSISDPVLRRKLIPDYTMGCKRVLVSNDYYPALARDNVDVVTDGVTEVREHSVVDGAGVEHEVDAIIYGIRFPEPVLPARPEHRARAQLRGVHDRSADLLRRAGAAARARQGAGAAAGGTGPVQRRDPAQAREGHLDSGRLQELVPRREGRQPDDLAGLHLAVLANVALRRRSAASQFVRDRTSSTKCGKREAGLMRG